MFRSSFAVGSWLWQLGSSLNCAGTFMVYMDSLVVAHDLSSCGALVIPWHVGC